MSIPILPEITAQTITTDRITTRVLFFGPEDGIPVLFLHGNLSSATWWEETMVSLPDGYRAIGPDQRGFGEAEPAAKIDATRGMRDPADDAIALMDYLGHERFHLVGNSLGGVVAWFVLSENAHRLLSVIQVGPGSPYGFGGTKDAAGTPTWPDYAGSGAGLSNPELIKRIAEGDTGTDSPVSPRSALRALVWKPPFIPAREDELVAATLQLHLGEDAYPGDEEMSPNWPYVSPGRWGVNNGQSPKYGVDVEAIIAADPKPPVLWVRGADDLAVSNSAASDPGTWGPTGILPGYPGPEVYPPQPMVDQTRAVLDRYQEAGGMYQEVVVDDVGHVPFIDKLDEFNKVFHDHLVNN